MWGEPNKNLLTIPVSWLVQQFAKQWGAGWHLPGQLWLLPWAGLEQSPAQKALSAQPTQAPLGLSAQRQQSLANTTFLGGMVPSTVMEALGTVVQRLAMTTEEAYVCKVDLVEGTRAAEYCRSPTQERWGTVVSAVPLPASWPGQRREGGEETTIKDALLSHVGVFPLPKNTYGVTLEVQCRQKLLPRKGVYFLAALTYKRLTWILFLSELFAAQNRLGCLPSNIKFLNNLL